MKRSLVIVAHEFAHILLESPGSGVSDADADDEDLADATVVMAGMGPLLLRASYREGISVSGDKAEWNVRRTGSLSPVAIAYLTLVQAEMAGLHADARRSLIGDWLEPAWSVRARYHRTGGLIAARERGWEGFAGDSRFPRLSASGWSSPVKNGSW